MSRRREPEHENAPPPMEEKGGVTEIAEGAVQRVVQSNFPTRPSYGTKGRKIKVMANHFPVRITTYDDVFHYDIAVGKVADKTENLDLSKNLRSTIVESFLKSNPKELEGCNIATDRKKNIYAPRKLPFTSHKFENIFPEDVTNGKPERSFWVTIKESNPCNIRMQQLEELFTGSSSYTPYEAIQALDIALRHTAAQRFVTVGRSLFQVKDSKPLGEGADLWFGYYQSLRATQSGLTLNVDSAATAFVKPGLVTDYIDDLLGFRGRFPKTMNRDQIRQASRALRGVKVNVTHRETIRKYRINKLSDQSAAELTFENEAKERVSVADYFKKNFGGLRFPDLPCVHVGAPSGNTYFPIEVCKIFQGQKLPKKVNDRQVASMIKMTCAKPHVRQQKIASALKDANFARDANVRSFNLEVDDRMMEVEARELPAPEIQYANSVERPRDGSWNMRNKSFYYGRSIYSWAVISFCDERRTKASDIDRFIDALKRQSPDLGMKIPSKRPPLIIARHREATQQVYEQAVGEANKVFGEDPQFILCVKPDAGAGLYGEIKRASDSFFGIVSQCMLSKHIMKCQPQYIANIMLKVNVKLGGRNSILKGELPKVADAPTIIFGADVTHPMTMDNTRPSLAALSASMDRYCSTHFGVVRKQGHRKEMIEDLEGMAIELLKLFYGETGMKPQRVVFYRDGVSEGQFQQVMDYEVQALCRAFERLEAGYRPRITFVVVQKRHHTRFFPMDRRDGDRSGNVKAGTVIETSICHPVEFDFYLMSHGGIQGTSRPAHYHVLLDENQFTSDELQTLTFYLSHNYVRCTKSVSIVPAVYYAHLLATRARFLCEDAGGSDTASMCSSSSGANIDLKMHEVHANLAKRMFFA